MVSDVVHLDTTISHRIRDGETEKDEEDAVSVSTTSTENCDGALVLQDAEDRAPCFQNIEVTNSSDVHFGNKTYYQGPVTIKQILYTNRDGEKTPQSNGLNTPLSINDKCVVENGNYNDGYATDGVYHITGNGNAKLPNGTHDHFNQIGGGANSKKLSQKQWIFMGGAIMIAALLIITAVALVFTLKSSGEESQDSPILQDPEENADTDYEPVLAPGLRLLDRSEWLAAPPREPYAVLNTPVQYVIIQETATTQCSTLANCKSVIISVQNFHMNSLSWIDIGFNFMVGGDGYSYEGRGWTSVGEHTQNYNNKSIGIALIGSFTIAAPPQRQIKQTQELIKAGVKNGFIRDDYKLIGLNQAQPTSKNPGQMLADEIKKWPHYVPTP